MGVLRRATTVAAAAIAGLAIVAATSPAALAEQPKALSTRGWVVTPSAFGIMYDNADAGSLSSVRAWEAATWCRVQPSETTDIASQLDLALGPQLDAQLERGATMAIVGLGHPAPWVFGNTAKAGRSAVEYACGNNAAGASIPNSASLKRLKDGSLSLQGQRWANYVGAVIDYISNRYGNRMQVMLQVYNEPNLKSGIDVSRRIPGAAWTIKDAVASLYAYEKITQEALRSRGVTSISLTSTSMFQKPNEFFTRYLSLQNKRPVVSSLSFNVYAARAKTPDKMLAEWNRQVSRIRSKINKHKRLRRLPSYITETNLNLVNNNYDKTNVGPKITNVGNQIRTATATQMDAFYHGFSAVYWLAPWAQQQAAVLIRTTPGNPARDALSVLRTSILGRTVQACRTKSKVRSCTFRDPTGARRDLLVLWRTSGSSRVKVKSTSTITYMTGEVSSAPAGSRLGIGTTPVVVQPN